ncbi:MAG: hypothetical protein ACK5LK_01600 [Chthoniobacterales bacterium]
MKEDKKYTEIDYDSKYPLEKPPFRFTFRMLVMLSIVLAFMILPIAIIFWAADMELKRNKESQDTQKEQVADQRALAPLKAVLESRVDAHFADEKLSSVTPISSYLQEISFTADSENAAEIWRNKLEEITQKLGIQLLDVEGGDEGAAKISEEKILVKRYLASINPSNFKTLQNALEKNGSPAKIEVEKSNAGEEEPILTEITLYIQKK